jgi:ribosomal protein S18 acetylase RimI-like enzyme
MPDSLLVRPAKPADLPAVGKLAGQLVRFHHALDARRFMMIDRVDEGYARFLGSELANPEAVVLCAAREPSAEIIGYAYGTMEPRDWNALLEPHGALHDVLVDPGARRSGVGERLVREMCRRLEAMGAPRVVLSTAMQNREAQALFAKLGFRSTMIEMTREASGR